MRRTAFRRRSAQRARIKSNVYQQIPMDQHQNLSLPSVPLASWKLSAAFSGNLFRKKMNNKIIFYYRNSIDSCTWEPKSPMMKNTSGDIKSRSVRFEKTNTSNPFKRIHTFALKQKAPSQRSRTSQSLSQCCVSINFSEKIEKSENVSQWISTQWSDF